MTPALNSDEPQRARALRLNTLVLSDIHLADAEPPHPGNPLWKRFKRPKHFIDRPFRDFLEAMQAQIRATQGADAPLELVLNGDIFDFDSVMALPEKGTDPGFKIHWLERRRGLNSEEPKSRFKMKTILDDHPVWVEAVRNYLRAGHRLVFVVGNHDLELQWPTVRAELVERLGGGALPADRITFCEWFYVSGGDTLVEHGNQYDPYCLSANPIHPLIRKGRSVLVRIPFGNLAGKYMTNGMGLFNPHADSTFIKDSVWEYAQFFFRYVLITQPLLVLTWFWGAIATLVVSVSEGLMPAVSDPLTVGPRVDDIAHRANSTPGVVWSLRELHAHPAIYNPFQILRELWLDRAILFGLVFFASFNFFSYLRVFWHVSLMWLLVPIGLLLPVFIFYAKSVRSEVERNQELPFAQVPRAAAIAGVRRVIHGHTHREGHKWTEGVEYLNTGTWSPAYRDLECTQPYGRKCFAWLRPAGEGARSAELYEWVTPKRGEPRGARAEKIEVTGKAPSARPESGLSD